MEALGSGSREQRELNTKKNPCQEKNFKTHEKNFAPCLLCSDHKHAIILGKDQRKESKGGRTGGRTACLLAAVSLGQGRQGR